MNDHGVSCCDQQLFESMVLYCHTNLLVLQVFTQQLIRSNMSVHSSLPMVKRAFPVPTICPMMILMIMVLRMLRYDMHIVP